MEIWRTRQIQQDRSYLTYLVFLWGAEVGITSTCPERSTECKPSSVKSDILASKAFIENHVKMDAFLQALILGDI